MLFTPRIKISMLYEKDKCWFIKCDGEGCKAETPYYYPERRSAESDIREYKWTLMPDDKCYCPKCSKKYI